MKEENFQDEQSNKIFAEIIIDKLIMQVTRNVENEVEKAIHEFKEIHEFKVLDESSKQKLEKSLKELIRKSIEEMSSQKSEISKTSYDKLEQRGSDYKDNYRTDLEMYTLMNRSWRECKIKYKFY